MKRILLAFGLMLLQGLFCLAGSVTPVDAGKAASNFFTAHLTRSDPRFNGKAVITGTRSITRDGKVLYYIFNMSPAGWIAVSADDAAWPVLAYSFEGSYTGENLPPQYVAWMKQYEDELAWMAGHPSEAPLKVSSEWKNLLSESYTGDYMAKNMVMVKPLLYSTWDQGAYYNGMCPAVSGGPGGHAWAGCVPTAMGQIMNYYRWPVTGTGSYSYTDPTFGVQSANFGATTYQWDNMPNSISRPNDGIALLLYHLGVSCDLVYGASGSGMYNHKAAYSLRTYFKYSPQTQYLFRDSTTLRWDSVIVAHLNRGMPLYYAGWKTPNIDGHAFVCDGYQDTAYFHFNWGWSGSSNGYYYTSNPSPPGYNFKLAQELIINCFPDTVNYTYPGGCQGSRTLSWFDGSLADGSGPVKNYQGNTDCSWLISPQTSTDSVSKITLTFNYISTGPQDRLKIYNGPSASSPILMSFTGDTVPSPISSSGNQLFITFKASGGATGKGFSLSYASTSPVWCTGTQVIQGDTADFTNGSAGFNYSNNTSCRWRLQRNDTLPLTIYFSRFDTEPLYDNLTIYDLGTGLPIDTISGHYDQDHLPAPVTAHSGKMFLIFSTNGSVTGRGWEIYYPKRNTGIEEKTGDGSLMVFPNPSSGKFSLQWDSPLSGGQAVSVVSADGRILIRKTLPASAGRNRFDMDAPGLQPGVYILRLESPGLVRTGKIVISKP